MSDVLFYDDRGGFGPSFNEAHAVGGAEIHLVQIAEYLAAKSLDVRACTHQDERDGGISAFEEGGVHYSSSRHWSPRGKFATLIVVGCASLPDESLCQWDRAYAFQVVDPRPHPSMWDHLRGKATMVCVSEWQAELFRRIGHQAIVIPVPFPDEWYGMQRDAVPDRFVCVSSWNKGALDTINVWDPKWGELAVGSAYSHPDNAAEICASRGVTWLGTLKRRDWIRALASGSYVARVCTIAETFGVTDTAAAALGMPAYTLCTGEIGSLDEVGATVTTRFQLWANSIRDRAYWPRLRDVNDFRASRVLPQWVDLVTGKWGG